MKHLHIDFETACSLKLSSVGLHRYIEDQTFQPLCVAWKLDARQPVVARLASREASQLGSIGLPTVLRELIEDPEVQIHAWNSAFEDRIIRGYYGVVPGRQLSCTMQRALAYGLPAKLERAAPAVGAAQVKDAAGRRVMLRMSKFPGKNWPEQDWAALMNYCRQDVMTEAEISGLIPCLSTTEQRLSELDRTMNNHGIWLDTETVQALAAAAREAEKAEGLRAAELTEGVVTSPGTQPARLVAWLGTQGLNLSGVDRPQVEQALAGFPEASSSPVAEVLGIRLRTARASTKKLATMLGMVSGGQRLRGQFQFLGAARTGRWSGRGIQPQNLPRVPKGFSPEAFIRTAQAGNGLDVVAPAPVLDCVSWSLRACLGEDGTPLWSFDFSQIEARVIAWLAGQEDVLEVFRDPSQDVYVWTAQQVGSDNRQLGKVLVLALGFGMGAAKLRSTAWENYGVRMTEAEAERFKREWRARNPRIVGFWYECEGAARDAILHPGRVYPVLPSAITFTATARTLQMRLPSGRVLYYHKPHVGTGGEITYWGEEKGAWKQRRTWGGTLAENATQAAARDIMAEAMSRVATCRGLSPLMTVHDELVYAAEDTEQLKSLMLEAPSWSGGLPIDGEAKMMTRYSVVTK